MKVYTEVHLKDFDTWCGANSTKDSLFEYELDIIEECLEELFPDGLSETQINDILWFETDTIAEWLGYESWEHLENEYISRYDHQSMLYL